MTSNRSLRRLGGTSTFLAGMTLAVVGLVPSVAGAQGGEPGPHGRLIVEKTVEGDTTATFRFNVACDDGIDRNFSLDANSTKEFAAIKTDSVCEVEVDLLDPAMPKRLTGRR